MSRVWSAPGSSWRAEEVYVDFGKSGSEIGPTAASTAQLWINQKKMDGPVHSVLTSFLKMLSLLFGFWNLALAISFKMQPPLIQTQTPPVKWFVMFSTWRLLRRLELFINFCETLLTHNWQNAFRNYVKIKYFFNHNLLQVTQCGFK